MRLCFCRFCGVVRVLDLTLWRSERMEELDCPVCKQPQAFRILHLGKVKDEE